MYAAKGSRPALTTILAEYGRAIASASWLGNRRIGKPAATTGLLGMPPQRRPMVFKAKAIVPK